MTPDRIAALSDAQAITALRLVLERQGHSTDPAQLRADQAHLTEALQQPDVRTLAEPDPDATPGSLARIALAQLAASSPESGELVDRAILISDRPGERFDPATLAVGALVLLAFRTDLRLERDPGKGWTFKLHTKPLSDSVIGKLVSQLLGTYLKN
jgi:hypothetical protein